MATALLWFLATLVMGALMEEGASLEGADPVLVLWWMSAAFLFAGMSNIADAIREK